MLKNKIIVVCGGLGRIGFNLTKEILKNGGTVICADINDSNSFKITKKYIKNFNYCKFDISKNEEIDKLIKFCNTFKKIDGIVNCAYPKPLNYGKKFKNLDFKYLNDFFNLHLSSSIIINQKFIKLFLKQKHGNIINFSSIQGISSPKFEHYKQTKMTSPLEYTAAKSSIIAITKYLAKYCKNKNIRINCISPGGIKDNQPSIFLKKYKEATLNKGMLDPDDIMGSIIFLLSDTSKYINGQNLIVDDGWSL